jgi:hypothetical protein
MCHSPTNGRVGEQQAISGIMFKPGIGIGLVEQGGMIETDAKTHGKTPVGLGNQTLQFALYFRQSFHYYRLQEPHNQHENARLVL